VLCFTNVWDICNVHPMYSQYTSLRMATRMAETWRRNTAFVIWHFHIFMCICWFPYIFQTKLSHRDILPLHILKKEAIGSFETSINIYKTTLHNIPEDSFLQKEYVFIDLRHNLTCTLSSYPARNISASTSQGSHSNKKYTYKFWYINTECETDEDNFILKCG
jgi:hypothetical protein